jgi:hypothetical protein
VKANNKHILGYDPQKKSTYELYLDANNLYGMAMVPDLPYKDLNLEAEGAISLDTILNTADDAETGYTVEVAMSFPKEIHERLKQLPPCPETLTPKSSWFSEFQKEVKIKTRSKNNCDKLVPKLS